MKAELSNTRHGMMSKLNRAVERACDTMERGTQSGKAWPAMDISRASGRETVLQHTFGRLFDRETEQPEAGDLRALAATMADDLGEEGDGPADAGMTFFGQFIDHDLTLEATTALGSTSGDVTRIRNFRTPRFDLDSVYGDGPEVTPFLYGHAGEPLALIIGALADDGTIANPHDLQRNRNGRALIGDPRNDENIFVSQVHGRQFVEEHNRILAMTTGTDGHERFEHARDELRHRYQRRVVEEFLPAVVAPDVLDPLLRSAIRHGTLGGPIDWQHAPDMPVEFSAAAFRFGHSMVRQRYALNDDFPEVELFSRVNMGFSPVSAEHNLDLDRFFGKGAQKSRAINTRIVPDLIDLPGGVASNPSNLAERNMIRGQHTFCLPHGETLARQCGFDVLDAHPQVCRLGLEGRTPLWFYVLWEAENNGGRLGPLGGSLVAGTILNLMLRDERSILSTGYYAQQAAA